MLRSGLIGRSILASRSPWLHEQEARAQGLELSYELFDFDDRGWNDGRLPGLLSELIGRGFSGFNVTYPFKQAVLPLLHRLDRTAELVGAVNTVAIRHGELIGHNTDMSGFRDNLVRGLPDADLGNVLQVGAGGAGSAVAAALLSLGTKRMTIADVDTARAKGLAGRLAVLCPEAEIVPCNSAEVSPDTFSGVVNASPVGMTKSPGTPVDTTRLRSGQWVADIVYFPLETELLRSARDRGCRTLDGSGMVIGQAALAFEIIAGHRADLARMRESFAQAAD